MIFCGAVVGRGIRNGFYSQLKSQWLESISGLGGQPVINQNERPGETGRRLLLLLLLGEKADSLVT